MAADESQSQKQEEEDQESETQKGHGRNGIDKYLGANVIPVANKILKNGDPCPECPSVTKYA